jgi:segregation and condensation protein A
LNVTEHQHTEHADFESSPDAYKVKLDSFEGPLDLLIHLIRKNEVNIYDIPIALITEQYLSYLALMQELNLDVAGEFLVMAATLIHIKSRTLLPRPDPTQNDEPEEDPREALVRRLLEHQKYKAAAELLHERETLRSAQFMRPDSAVSEAAGDEYEPELEVDLFSLIAAFKGRARASQPSAAHGAAARGDSDRDAHQPAFGAACQKPRRAVSRICFPTATDPAVS